MKLITTITITAELADLSGYQDTDSPCETIEEAAALEQKWLEDGTSDVYDFLGGDNVKITVRGEL